MKTHLGINGAAGRMGLRLVALAQQDPSLKLVAALESPENKALDRDVGELAGVGPLHLPVRSYLLPETRIDVLIDFSTPEGTLSVLPICTAKPVPLVVATTGHTPEQLREVADAAHQTAVLHAPNLSLVVNVLFKLVQLTARTLKEQDFDVEVVERHHRFKKDSPSGTALHFVKLVQAEMGQSRIVHGREGVVGERPRGEIGVHAVRVGDNVGEHTVIFSTLGETLELVHRGHSRDSYALGALAAAKFLAGKPAGSYSMADVLGLG